ncbi:hypothetical protein E3N88_30998 [Mikania micrantha]|uniref:ADP/ATP translocase n=1 Tax=Mikania micrantha TaxID=192012 RepID=A0A5N6MR58_9ASTR|nr:hypothetical protein E3N88_30998 [Mikania micrantha]
MVAENGGDEGSRAVNSEMVMMMHSYRLTNFSRDLMAGAMMGGMHELVFDPYGGCTFFDFGIYIVFGVSYMNNNSNARKGNVVVLKTKKKNRDLYKSILRSGKNSHQSTFISGSSANFIAGAAAGCTALVLIYPLDIAHTRLAADLGKTDSRQFQGIRHFLTTIWARNGIRGVYKGLPASLQGMVVHRGLYFGGFDTLKEKMSKNASSEVALWKRWIVAQAVTTSAGLLSYPLDTVRRRMMMQSGIDRPMYRNTLDCWKTIYQTEGFMSFYRGALSNMFRSTGAAAILVLYDEAKKFMNWSGS